MLIEPGMNLNLFKLENSVMQTRVIVKLKITGGKPVLRTVQ